ncbi:mucin-2-like [Physella acuta]|uniref:mucin-2-like n=1 Tax=Physella acuta TaxID=109671 RepID=UPI0027DE0B4A|nr:mucin-2-like [Physella acuta]
MSAVEDAVSNDSVFTQQNGDVYNKHKATTEKIKSVHENPFYKQLGIKHSVPPHRPSYRSDSSDIYRQDKQVSNGHLVKEDDEDDKVEYRPGSGFVTRLLGKFTSLTAKEESASSASHTYLKRFSSLDELSADDVSKHKSVTFKEPTYVEKPSSLSTSKLSRAHKSGSVDCLNHAHRRSNQLQSNVDSKWNSNKPSGTSKFSRDSHIEAPDVDLARDDIIIIERTPPVPTLKDSSNDSTDGLQSQSSHHEDHADEFPKPNTVSHVRNIFENASTNAANDLYARRRRPDSSSSAVALSLQTDASIAVSSNQDNAHGRFGVSSPSPVTSPRICSPDLHAKPVLLPSSSVVSKPFEHPRRPSDSSTHLPYSSKTEDQKLTATVASNVQSSSIRASVKDAAPSSNDTSTNVIDSTVESVPDSKSTTVERNNYFSTGRPTPTPRNTASIKPTIVNRPSSAVKPVPLSAPASAATSYKKSSPVVPVAPFKDKQDDVKDDGQPVLVFNKSKLSPRREKVQRVKDYSTESSAPNKTDSVDKDVASTEESNNKISSTRKSYYEKTADGQNSDQSTIIHIKQHTTIEIKKTVKPAPAREPSTKSSAPTKSTYAPKPRESTKQTVAPLPPNNIKNNEQDSSVPETPRPAPVVKEPVNSVSQETTLSKIIQKSSMSDEKPTPLDTATASETQPIKGIPSIIAQRLRLQNSDPSQVADDVVSSTDMVDGSRKAKHDETPVTDDSPSPRKRLTPTTTTPVQSTSSSSKDNISSEIENEIAAVRKKMEGNRSKSTSVSQIFDSSQLSKKRKENQKQRVSAQGLVPPLDLSGITDDQSDFYQPAQREIKPCNIKFIGENAKTSRSLLTRNRKIKVSIHFNDSKTETFEYPSEEYALEKYLEEHPNETAEILIFDTGSGDNGESSDDVGDDIMQTPRTGEDEVLRSNTALSHTGNLQSYRGRYQEDYQFGAAIKDPEPIIKPLEVVEDPDSLMLRPAEDDTNTWSTNSSSDLLF